MYEPDTIYLHEAMKDPDLEEFIKAMVKEVTDQMENENYYIIPKSQVPTGSSILPEVCQMKRKQDIKTSDIKKRKARLNIDEHRMKKGIHYDQKYAPYCLL